MDFAIALADYLKPSGRVFCAVLDASREDRERAQARDVILVPIGKDINSSSFDEAWAYIIWETLQHEHGGLVIDWWVGHDVTSAQAALKGPQIAGGHTAVIMHMNYADYASYRHGSGAEAVRKETRQRELFRRAEKHFAVGPLLCSAMRDMVEGDVTMLVPGFADVPIRPAKHRLTAITFGRMDRESDRIKQGGLAVAGFAGAVRRAHEMSDMPRLLCDNPQMRVIGINEEKGPEEQALRQFAHQKAGRQINLLAQPFDEDRDRLFDQLGRANIALMLSWHEGFGLTGWEAIAAEVPLIVSKRSGLYKLVHEGLEGLGDNCLRVIDVQGREGDDETSNFTPKDEEAARDAILDITSDLPGARQRAKHLKKLLQDKLVCTWMNTARQFCEAIGLEPKSSMAPDPPVALSDCRESPPPPNWFVSYAWGDDTPEGKERQAIVDRICDEAEARETRILRDKDEIGLGDRISKFMRQLGQGDRVFIILSDKYLKSPFCMCELYEVWRNSWQDDEEFLKRIRVYTMPDATIWTLKGRLAYAVYWRQQYAEVEALVKEHGYDILGDRGYQDYRRMKQFFGNATDILTAVTDILQPRSFDELVKYGLSDLD